jgi:predicted deacylase
MQYQEYTERFLEHARVCEVRPFAHIVEGGKRYPLISATTPGRRTLLITAGFHGDETAGPLTLMEFLPSIVEYARKRDVGLKIYPCLNPSGFEDLTRYNRSGEAPNNDLLRYELTPGVWAGELERGQTFISTRANLEGPKETRALAAELEAQPAPHAALDIHQDPYLAEHISYAYNFGDNAIYRPLLAATNRILPLATNFEVDDDVITDEDGLIQLHDGSVTDYFHRRGVPLTVALETTTSSPMAACHEVDLVWIRGFVDLLART